jgi:hypothetical protein
MTWLCFQTIIALFPNNHPKIPAVGHPGGPREVFLRLTKQPLFVWGGTAEGYLSDLEGPADDIRRAF